MHRILLTVLLLASSLFVSATSNAARNDPDICGTITNIHRASGETEDRFVGTVLVEAQEKTSKVDKANLIITRKTRILREQDGKRVQATFEDLKVGQLVEAQFAEGPTIMIYPLQVVATEIVILNAGDGNR